MEKKPADLLDRITEMQGIILALTLLDTFPGGYTIRMMPALHTLHAMLETQINDLSEKANTLEGLTRSVT